MYGGHWRNAVLLRMSGYECGPDQESGYVLWHISEELIRAGNVRLVADSVAKLDEGRLARNNRIVAKKILNRYCALVAVLESMLLAQVPKILLQHYLAGSGLA
jgi:hypothetical protein